MNYISVISNFSVLQLFISFRMIQNDKDIFSFLTLLPFFKKERIKEDEQRHLKKVLNNLSEKYINSSPIREFVLNLFNTNKEEQYYYDFCHWLLDIDVLWVIYNIKKEYGKKIDYTFIYTLYQTRVNDIVDIKLYYYWNAYMILKGLDIDCLEKIKFYCGTKLNNKIIDITSLYKEFRQLNGYNNCCEIEIAIDRNLDHNFNVGSITKCTEENKCVIITTETNLNIINSYIDGYTRDSRNKRKVYPLDLDLSKYRCLYDIEKEIKIELLDVNTLEYCIDIKDLLQKAGHKIVFINSDIYEFIYGLNGIWIDVEQNIPSDDNYDDEIYSDDDDFDPEQPRWRTPYVYTLNMYKDIIFISDKEIYFVEKYPLKLNEYEEILNPNDFYYRNRFKTKNIYYTKLESYEVPISYQTYSKQF
jgi:hypothetical protein